MWPLAQCISSSREHQGSSAWCSSGIQRVTRTPLATSNKECQLSLSLFRSREQVSSLCHVTHHTPRIRGQRVTALTLTPSSSFNVADREDEDPHTGQVWENFAPYNLDQRGPPDVPNRFLQNAQWREDQGSVGYYAVSGLIRTHIVPVEFNQEHLCWVELRYNRRDGNWTAFRIAEHDLGLRIYFSDITPGERLRVLGAGGDDEESESNESQSQSEESPHRGDEPSSETDDTRETPAMVSEPEEICVHQPIDEEEMRLIQRAESLHIHDEPRIAATQVEEARVNCR